MAFLIVGLGNPGKIYEGTRHNVGFALLEQLAQKYGLSFRRKSKWESMVAQGMVDHSPLTLIKPLTFMNQSGLAVAAVLRDLKIDRSHLLIIVDDIAIPLEQIRWREEGSSGGHNGLKSVEESLQTTRFPRLRIGVGDRKEGDLADHVLGRFSEEEEKLVPAILERAVQSIEIWMAQGITSAMDFANRRPSNPSNGE